MYTLLAIDSTLRIVFAMAFLFVFVPRLAGLRTNFWVNFAWGVVILTIAGQLLTLMKLYALPTLLLLCALVMLIARAARQHRSPLALLADAHRWITVATINLLERRVSVRRRMRRGWRRARASLRIDRMTWGWIALTIIAAAFRLYRPFASANLGFSDSYVHLYLVKLLDQGRQVDPAWGPYPRGMHFTLLAIQRLTNIDEILLVNFFGAIVGVLLTLAVAWTTKRLAGSHAAGLLSGLIFATMVGGPRQYFILGGSFESLDRSWIDSMLYAAYAQVPPSIGEFDVLLTAFQRQSSTLSQEMAIVLLFPAVIFLLDWLRGDERARWAFIGCTAAIAATHSGVLVPLVIICAIAGVLLRSIVRPALAGLAGIALGSTWLLGFIAYPYIQAGTRPGSTALYYFPFLRHFAGDAAGGTSTQEVEAFNAITPLLIVLALVAIVLLVRGKVELKIAGAIYLVFFVIHVSSRIGLPQIVESRRNSEWFLMSIAMLIALALTPSPPPVGGEGGRRPDEGARAESQPLTRLRHPLPAWAGRGTIACVLAALWLARVPSPTSLRDRMLNYSGYGSASLAVVEIAHKYEPFTWTLVSYGQEYPMVLGRGFHITAAEFLDRYDPAGAELDVPTRYVFVLTERKPHHFEVRDWTMRFSRGDIEHRLETWCQLYQATHDNARLFLDDGNVQVFQISRSQAEANRIAKEARMQ